MKLLIYITLLALPFASAETVIDEETGKVMIIGVRTREASAANQLGVLFDIYAKENGQYPGSWKELSAYDDVLYDLSKSIEQPIVSYFKFVTHDGPIEELHGNSILLVAAKPQVVDGKQTRYSIISNDDDVRWMPIFEDHYQDLSEKYNILLMENSAEAAANTKQVTKKEEQNVRSISKQSTNETEPTEFQLKSESEQQALRPWVLLGLALIVGSGC